jgi:MscS family membrane protein
LWAERLQKKGEESAAVLVQPVRKIAKGLVVLFAALLWLDNIGFNVSALLAGLGVGGIAVALAAQDTLKNFFGSVMILLDKPYSVGQRVTVKGHDGVVEEIGLRSTRIRLLTGHQTTVPNEQMANVDIENIGRRPHIRRRTDITITYDTPPEKIEKAVNIIETILDDHEGMEPDFPHWCSTGIIRQIIGASWSSVRGSIYKSCESLKKRESSLLFQPARRI